jgi:hypothetical protein
MDQNEDVSFGVLANKTAREQAEALLNELVPELLDGVAPISMQRFWETIARYAAAKIGCVIVEDTPSVAPMSEDEAMRYEATRVPFGQYQGVLVREVPPQYWLIITESQFHVKLRRYMRSSRFERLQG